MTYAVQQHRQEIGVRMALGATPGAVLRMIMRQGMGVAAVGAGVGAIATLWLAPLLAALLYRVSPGDAGTERRGRRASDSGPRRELPAGATRDTA